MKKNITINLFGSLYCIDEDAYALLQKYTDSMKSYFARQEGGEEIADDIEHRVAELMWQKKEEGNEAIDIDMIKEIIAKIGNPAEIDGKEDEPEEKTERMTYSKSDTQTENTQEKSSSEKSAGENSGSKWNLNDRHLYRNPKDKKLGGVCSGLALFFNGGKDTGVNDATFWRLGFLGTAALLLFYVPWWMPDVLQLCVPVIYIILWIIMPEAKTPEDMVRMKGMKVTPENINEEILREEAINANNNTTQVHAAYQQQQNNNSGCLKVLFGGCLAICLFPFLIALFAFIIALIAVAGVGAGLLGDLLNATPLEHLPALLATTKLPLLIGTISIIAVLTLIIWLIIRWLRGSDKKMSATAITIIILIILIGIGCGIFGLVSSAGRFAKDAHFYINTTSTEWNSDHDDWKSDDDEVFDQTLPEDTIKSDTLFIQ